jgi:hypothetical protein
MYYLYYWAPYQLAMKGLGYANDIRYQIHGLCR